MNDARARENFPAAGDDVSRAPADAYERLRAWCRARDYAGFDPFDALNSRLFQATPLRHSRAARLAWTQLFKRSPLNLRPLALVAPERNAKGTALFALAALARFRTYKATAGAKDVATAGASDVATAGASDVATAGASDVATAGASDVATAGASDVATAEAGAEARELLESLLAARLEGWSGAAWGYNFDWQGRAFYAPRGTPTVVPTAFAARALVEASRAFDDGARYLGVARSACDFIMRDLERSAEGDGEVCFSYTPHDRTRVFNASLLAGETLATVGALTGERELCDAAMSAARYVVRRQRADGSWAYGADGYQSWADNFHTAFVLGSLASVIENCAGGEEFAEALRRGFDFWRETFFLADGWPKYYHDRLYPADAHSAAAAVVTLLKLGRERRDVRELAAKVARWAVRNLQDERGFFYYQRRRFVTVRTPYMRWSQAWMLYALARLLEKQGDAGCPGMMEDG